MNGQKERGLFILGVTGPSGAGKSLAARHLAARGFAHLDADLAARAVVNPGSPCLAALAAAFGGGIIRQDGSLDRKKLGQLAFAGGRVGLLNSITHPYILKEIESEFAALAKAGFTHVCLDAPTLFESGSDRLCDKVLAVLADRELRLSRIMARDGLSPEAARTRMDAQPSDAFYIEKADFCVYSDGGENELLPGVDRVADIVLQGEGVS